MLHTIVIWVLSLPNTVQFHSAIDDLYKKILKLRHILKPFPIVRTMNGVAGEGE